MAIDTGTNLTFSPAFPVQGVTQASQPFRDNFSVIKQAVESLQQASSTAGSVLSLTTAQDSHGVITYALGFGGNAFVLPSGDPTISLVPGMIRQAMGLIQVYNGTAWQGAGSAATVTFTTTGAWSANELLGSVPVPHAFLIDAGSCYGWSNVGGAAATTVFSIQNAASVVYATVTYSPSVQAPIFNIIIPNVPAGSVLQMIAPSSVDLNLTGMAVTLASL